MTEKTELATSDAIATWRHECMRRVHFQLRQQFRYIDRDDASGELIQHMGEFTIPPEVEKPLIVLVHPLDCECPEAPHIARTVGGLGAARDGSVFWPGT